MYTYVKHWSQIVKYRQCINLTLHLTASLQNMYKHTHACKKRKVDLLELPNKVVDYSNSTVIVSMG